MQVQIENSSGTVLGAGPLMTATNWAFKDALDRIGEFSFEMLADDPRSSYVVEKRIARCLELVEGTWKDMGAGIIDRVEKMAEDNDKVVVRVSGAAIGRELTYRTVGNLLCAQSSVVASYGPGGADFDVSIVGPGAMGSVPAAMDLNTGTYASVTIDCHPPAYDYPGDYLYIGYKYRFTKAHIDIGPTVPNTTTTLSFQYYDAGINGWKDITVTDGTAVGGKPFMQSGDWTFTAPDDWCPLNGKFYLRARPAQSLNPFDLAEVRVYAPVTVSDALTRIIAFAPTGWTVDTVGGHSGTSIPVYVQFANESVLQALVTLSEITGEHFRLTSDRKVVWLQDDPLTAPIKVYAIRQPNQSQNITADKCFVKSVTESKDTYPMISRIYPVGAGIGNAQVTLARSTRSGEAGWPAGYTLDLANNCIIATGTEATYTRIDQNITWKNISAAYQYEPYLTMAANALCDSSLKLLQRRSVPQYAYQLSVARVAVPIYPGDRIHLMFRQVLGGRSGLDIDRDLIVLSVSYGVAGGKPIITGLDVSTTDAWGLSQADYMLSVIKNAGFFQSHSQAMDAGQGFSGSSSGKVLTSTGAGNSVYREVVVGVTQMAPHELVGPQHLATGIPPSKVVKSLGTNAAAWDYVAHSELTGVGANDHHAQQHNFVSSDHLASGLTVGQVIKATGPTTYAWANIAHTELSSVGPNDHHAQQHVLATSAALGPDHTVSGLTVGHFLRAMSGSLAHFSAILLSDLPDTFVPVSRRINSGAGLTGGGDLTVDRTLDVGQGLGITVNPDDVAINYGYAGTWTAKQTFSNGASMGAPVDFAGDVQIQRKGADLLALGSGDSLESLTYSPGTSGFHVGANGDAEFNNVEVRGALKVTVLQYGHVTATNGSIIVVPSAGKLYADCTSVDKPTTFTVDVEDPEGMSHVAAGTLWHVSDIIRLKEPLTGDLWASISSLTDMTTYWRLNVLKEYPAAGTNHSFLAALAVLNYGQTGAGGVRLTADATGSPFVEVFTHAGAPWSTMTTRSKLGNLKGWGPFAADAYGWAAGDFAGGSYAYYAESTGLVVSGTVTATAGAIGGWLLASNRITDNLSTPGINMVSGGTPYLAFGNPPPTGAAAGSGIFIDKTGLYGLNAGNANFKIDATGNAMAGDGSAWISRTGIFLNASNAVSQNFIKWVDGSGNAVMQIGLYSNLGTMRGGYTSIVAPGTTDATYICSTLTGDGLGDRKTATEWFNDYDAPRLNYVRTGLSVDRYHLYLGYLNQDTTYGVGLSISKDGVTYIPQATLDVGGTAHFHEAVAVATGLRVGSISTWSDAGLHVLSAIDDTNYGYSEVRAGIHNTHPAVILEDYVMANYQITIENNTGSLYIFRPGYTMLLLDTNGGLYAAKSGSFGKFNNYMAYEGLVHLSGSGAELIIARQNIGATYPSPVAAGDQWQFYATDANGLHIYNGAADVFKISTNGHIAMSKSIGCRVYANAANFTGAGAAWYSVSFNAERYDEYGAPMVATHCWTAGAPSRMVAPVAGIYVITAHVQYTVAAAFSHRWQLLFNGSYGIDWNVGNANGDRHIVELATTYQMAAGEYVELQLYKAAGDGTVTTISNGASAPEMTIARVA